MSQFIKRMLFFSSPIFIYILLVLYIDPFNIIQKESNQRLIELKQSISGKVNYPLYKLQKFSDDPTDIVLFGDSRTDKLETRVFDSLTKISSTNLAYGGGTLPEIIKSFWYATKVHNLRQVYIGINFNLYNADNSMDRVTEAINLKNSPISYLLSQACFKSSSLIIKSLINGKTVTIEKPDISKDEFWKYQLESSANNFYRNYKYPNNYFKGLLEISDYCKKKNIKLIFFVPPTHIELQQKVNEFELNAAEIRFKSDLSKLGLFYDFDYPNSLTENKGNFSDPFHYNDSIANIVINEIVTGKINYARTHNNGYK